MLANFSSAQNLTVDFNDPSDLDALHERVAHNDHGYPYTAPYLNNGSLFINGSIFSTILPEVGNQVSFSVDFTLNEMTGIEHPFQVGFTTGYSGYNSSSTYHEASDYGTLFGPGTQFSLMLINIDESSSQLRYSTGWGSERIDSSYDGFDLSNYRSLRWNLNYSEIRVSDGYGGFFDQGTVVASLIDTSNGQTLYSNSFNDTIVPQAKVSFSSLTGRAAVERFEMDYTSSVPEPSSFALLIGASCLFVLLRRKR